MAPHDSGIMQDTEKAHISDHEYMHDTKTVDSSSSDYNRAATGALTDEELALEKRLKRKIDAIIMPMVVLVGELSFRDDHIVLTEWRRFTS